MRLYPIVAALLMIGLMGISPIRAQQPEAQDAPSIEELLKRLPAEVTPEGRKVAEQMFRQMAAMRKQLPLPLIPGGLVPPLHHGRSSGIASSRLGADLEAPSTTLAEQLDLPKGQGMVLKDVQTGSAAAKAGLKAHDVLLEIDAKPVTRDVQEFDKQLEKIKEDQAVSVLFLRKGKTETIKELKLPKEEAGAKAPPVAGFDGPLPLMVPVQGVVAMPEPVPLPLPVAPLMGPFGQGVLTTVFRTADRATVRHQEGSLIITLSGHETKVKEIKVQDGLENNSYESLEKVPAAYRDKVKSLAELIEKSSIKIEKQKP